MNAINVGDQVEYIGKIKENPFWDLSTPFYVKRVYDDEVHLVDEIGDLGCFPVSPKDIRKIEDRRADIYFNTRWTGIVCGYAAHT